VRVTRPPSGDDRPVNRAALRARLSRVRWRRLVLVGGGGGLLLLLGLFGIAYAATDVPPVKADASAQATVLLYADGGEIGRVGQQNRVVVPLSEVPDHVQKAVLAAEDRGFYTEPGISPKGILRALFTNIRGGGVQQGGSSITQQYAKNAFLTQDRTYTRKVKEVLIALKMSRTVSKDKVLEDYLNTIYFGRGASGIEVAAQTYFGKRARDLTLAEGAVLASSIRSPAAYDPTRHRERAEDRFEYVVNGMIEEGWLEQGETAGLAYPRVLEPGQGRGARNNDLSGPKGHVITQVMEELQEQGFGEDRLAAGGLVVQTTLRRKAQEAAIAAVQDVVGANADNKALQGALVAVKPQTGEVFAYYGGSTGTGYDYAGQGLGRQPGSSFKPYVLAAALEEGISLRSRFDGNSPKSFPGQSSPVDNFGNQDFGRVDLVEATAKSINTAYYELGLEVGPDKVADLAHRAGIPEEVRLEEDGGRTNGGIALGTYEVHVIDQAVGFATFANGGTHVTPYFVKRVTQGEDEVYTGRVEEERAFEEDVAADAVFAMQQVVERGTGTRARLDGVDAAGKTGTTQANGDAWFVGFTPQLSAAAWIGYGDAPRTIRIDGVEATGGGFSTRIWKAFMDATNDAYPDLAKGDFPPRADIGRAKDPAPRGTGGPAPTATAAPTATTAVPTSAPPASVPPVDPGPTEEPPPTSQPTSQPTAQPPPPSSPAPAPTGGAASPEP
jgi:membrane peptidoglycan carboxypeptidase